MCDGNQVGNSDTEKTAPGDWSTAKDMTRWAGCLTFDIMGDICFSQSFEMLEKERNRYILDMLPKGVQGLNIVGHLDSHLFRASTADANTGGTYARPPRTAFGQDSFSQT